MKIKLCNVLPDDTIRLNKIEELYISSFPKEERKPFVTIIQKTKEGSMEILSVESETTNEFLGLAICVVRGDLALLDYFAICGQNQGSGIGTNALELLKQRFSDKRFFLEIETPDPDAHNAVQRERRKKFYLSCGMCDINLYVRLFGIDMEILTNVCNVTFSEYHKLYDDVFGSMISDNVKPGRATYQA